MKLYDSPMPAPNPRRVRIFLAEKGIDVPLQPVSIIDREQKSADYMKKNSLGQVPILELDDGRVIAESVSICRYFEALHPEPALFGTGAEDVALTDMWLRRVEFALTGPVGQFWRHAHPFTAKVVNQVPAFGEQSRDQALKAFQWLDGEMAERPFIAGERFSVADITALCTIDFAAFTGIEMPDTCANLKRWHEEVSARKSASA